MLKTILIDFFSLLQLTCAIIFFRNFLSSILRAKLSMLAMRNILNVLFEYITNLLNSNY